MENQIVAVSASLPIGTPASVIRKNRLNEARKRGQHTQEQWFRLLNECHHQCVRCGSSGSLTKDHIIPIAWDGSDSIENIQPLCKKCNCSKIGSIDWRPSNVGLRHPRIGSVEYKKAWGSLHDLCDTNERASGVAYKLGVSKGTIYNWRNNFPPEMALAVLELARERELVKS